MLSLKNLASPIGRRVWLCAAWQILLLVMIGNARAHAGPVTGLSLTWPVPSGFTSKPGQGYGQFNDGSVNRHHSGIDIPAPVNTPVVAAAGGTVRRFGLTDTNINNKTHCLGNAVIIQHSGGSAATLYGHLNSITVSDGQFVSPGQQIGTVGNTLGVKADETSCGTVRAHLHFELKNVAVLGTTSDDGLTWGYTPDPGTPGQPIPAHHPDNWGYHDPILNLVPGITNMTPVSVIVSSAGSGKNMRIGPDTSYRSIGQTLLAGQQFSAVSQLNMGTSGCSSGWYQLNRIGGQYFDDLSGETGSIRDVWVCRGNGTETWVIPSTPSDTVIFQDNIESGPGGWLAESPWGITTATSHSATHSWTDSPNGNYANNSNKSLWSPVLNLSSVNSARLTFWHRYDLENARDFGNVWVTTNNGVTFTQMASFTGTNTTWTQATINLNAYAGQPSVRVVFQLLSDSSVTRDGWYIDDVVVAHSNPIIAFTPSQSGNGRAVAFDPATGRIFYTLETSTNIFITDANNTPAVSVNPGIVFGALAWDAKRRVLWGGAYQVSEKGNVYQVTPGGIKTFRFKFIPPGGNCYGSAAGFFDGLAYDEGPTLADTDDTLWISDDGGLMLHHLDLNGNLIASFPIPKNPRSGNQGCNSGIAVDGDFLWLALQSGPDVPPHDVIQVAKRDPTTIISSFPFSDSDSFGPEGLALDSVTIPGSRGLWSNEFGTQNELKLWEIAQRPPSVSVDFDGDGKADVGIYRNGAWSIIRSSDGGMTNVGWGGPSWIPVVADYDGDGIADIAVRNANGLWSIVRSSNGENTLIGWSAAANDIPVPADYDGDGKADFAVYNNATAGWSIIRSSDGGLTYRAWGGPAWAPVEADYDGDGKVDIAVRNASNGLWSILRSSDSGNTLFGWSAAANDIPVPADYDGDGKADFAVYNTASGGWSIIRSSDGGLTYKAWGGPGWIPVPADYDGDGKADIAVYNPSNGLWSILRSSDGGNTLVGLGGAPEDIPLSAQ